MNKKIMIGLILFIVVIGITFTLSLAKTTKISTNSLTIQDVNLTITDVQNGLKVNISGITNKDNYRIKNHTIRESKSDICIYLETSYEKQTEVQGYTFELSNKELSKHKKIYLCDYQENKKLLWEKDPKTLSCEQGTDKNKIILNYDFEDRKAVIYTRIFYLEKVENKLAYQESVNNFNKYKGCSASFDKSDEGYYILTEKCDLSKMSDEEIVKIYMVTRDKMELNKAQIINDNIGMHCN